MQGLQSQAPTLRVTCKVGAWLCMTLHDFAWLCVSDFAFACQTLLLRVRLCSTLLDFARLCILGYLTVQSWRRLYECKVDFAWLCMTLHDFAWLCTTLHDFARLCMTLHDFACVNDTFQNVFLQPCKVVLQSIANTCKVNFLYMATFNRLNKNNRESTVKKI